VRQFREGTPPKLEREIKAFVTQEVMHSREHVQFNKRAIEAGYDLAPLEERVEWRLSITRSRPPIVNLAATMCLEHFTAILAHQLLKNPRHLGRADPESAALWRWHAIEEIEHKGVAYDTWLHATREWSRWKRWRLKSLLMLVITRRFVRNRFQDAKELLAQDGITGRRAKARLVWYLVGRPGILRRVFPAWCAYFLPGFHPWNHDDRALIGKYDSEFRAANLPAGA